MEILKRDAEIAFLKRQLNGNVPGNFDQMYYDQLKEIY